jgi:hypothetical protein
LVEKGVGGLGLGLVFAGLLHFESLVSGVVTPPHHTDTSTDRDEGGKMMFKVQGRQRQGESPKNGQFVRVCYPRIRQSSKESDNDYQIAAGWQGTGVVSSFSSRTSRSVFFKDKKGRGFLGSPVACDGRKGGKISSSDAKQGPLRV